jgi:cytochrome c-type biogenesis protein
VTVTGSNVTVAFAFAAGLATFFSPCVFALLPGYVGYYVGAVESESAPLSGALVRGLAASLGALGTFAALSVAAVGATAAVEQALPVVEPLVGVLLVGLGGALFWNGTLAPTVALPERRAGVLGFVAFGALYALAATACVLPLFLSITVASVGLSVTGTAVVLASYAAAFALLMLSATVAVAVGQEALLDRFAGRAHTLTRGAAIVLVLAGLAQLSLAFFIPSLNPLG